MNERIIASNDPVSADAGARAEASAPGGQPQRRGRVAPAAGRRADHRAGAQRRAVSRAWCSRSRSAASARAPPRRRPRACSARSASCCRASPTSTSPAPTTCTGSAPPPTCCATSRPPTARITRSARASSASACCSSWRAIRSRSRACSSSSEPEQHRPGHRGRAHTLKQRAVEILQLLPQVPEEMVSALQGVEGPARLADFIAGLMDIGAEEKQALLETFDLKARLDKLLELLSHRIEVLKVSREIDERTKESIDDRNRKHLLREQMRTIQKELGEGDEGAAEIAELDKAIADGEDARGGREAGAQGAEAPRAHARGRRRVLDGAHLPRLADRAAVGGRARGGDRHRRGAAHPRRGPLRAREDQEAHPRVPRGAQAQSDGQEPDPVLRRSARRGQDLARPEHRQGDRAQVRAREPGRRARRGRDPRPPAHLHRRAAGQHHPEPAQGRHAQLRDDARRGRQARRGRLPRRPGLGAARSARPGAELDVPRQLPRGAVRPVAA